MARLLKSETVDHSVEVRLDDRLARRSEDSFNEAERNGLMLAAKVRTFALCIVLLWVAVDTQSRGISFLYDVSQVAVFAILGIMQYYFAKYSAHARVLKYAFVAVDCALLALISSIQNPFTEHDLPPAILMNGSQFTYFYLFLMQAAFSFRPSLVLWCGLCIVAARTGMLVWFVNQPGAFTNLDLTERTIEDLLLARSDPNFIFLGFWVQEILVCLLVTAGLAALVRRSRWLVESRIRSERSRTNLARYFSPNVVDRLASSEDNLGEAREQEVAVMFVDIIGFTTMCENDTPGEVVSFLRRYHDRLGKAVFENGGTLDKYLGDGLMATFGTPEPGGQDARDALQCAFDMLDSLDDWNRERKAAGFPQVRIGIGIHYGPVVSGDIGNQRRLEYSVIGDTVNVASRLEQLTRTLECSLVASDSVIQGIRPTDDPGKSLVERLEPAGEHVLRGRRGKISAWAYPPKS
ncbi:adenylate/guanylate cyclase domain-containing protein [Ruegeria atlantica]|uniref:Adenylate cyclase 1 n=1 Tax=Ruegeria atlantica TaxID=81569 RepID=A0A0P1EBD6_9RHOB|nr:adenylate/guanylate cyclase domain-containing protein [Ruegeria atlantica]CUH46201.1 Adenylate cyclase 1 [Ruegeria atlantica]